jgi:GrpB-like predicted nucleotidyltransferase (UPF0157 family)
MNRNEYLIIRPYDIDAPKKYAAAKKFLFELIQFPFEVEHVGSSSVEGLGGKRVIDTLIICSKENMKKVVSLLESAKYKFNPMDNFGTFPERYFISGWFPYKDGNFHVHYHITFPGSTPHKEMLLFRNYLRQHYEEAKEYYDKKKKGCIVAENEVRFVWDKTDFVKRIINKAEKEITGHNATMPHTV